MVEIGASDARNKFSALLDRVERGEEAVITRRRQAVAKLVPVSRAVVDRSEAREAARRICECAKAMNLGPFGWEEWKRYRDEGRG